MREQGTGERFLKIKEEKQLEEKEGGGWADRFIAQARAGHHGRRHLHIHRQTTWLLASYNPICVHGLESKQGECPSLHPLSDRSLHLQDWSVSQSVENSHVFLFWFWFGSCGINVAVRPVQPEPRNFFIR